MQTHGGNCSWLAIATVNYGTFKFIMFNKALLLQSSELAIASSQRANGYLGTIQNFLLGGGYFSGKVPVKNAYPLPSESL